MDKSIVKLIVIFIVFTLNLNACNMSKKKYKIFPEENAPRLYPASQYSGYLFFEDETHTYILAGASIARNWGDGGGVAILNNGNMFALPDWVEIAWLSIVECKFYGVRAALPKERIQELLELKDPEGSGEQLFEDIVFGMAPYGALAVWLVGGSRNEKYTIEVAWLQGEEADIKFSDYDPESNQTQEEFCEWALQHWHEEANAHLQKNGLPDKDLFNNYMAKFNYRIVPVFEKKDTGFKVSNVRYYNGEEFMVTYDIGKYNQEDLLLRHDLCEPKAKPYKINVFWKQGKHEYDGFFWTDEKKIVETFAKFYGDNRERNGELVIEIGEDNKTFRFFLRDTAAAPDDSSSIVEIPLEEMEIIVFKNRFESFRSNYNRPDDGWRD